MKHLSSRTVADIPLPLPNSSEQHRIVAKLDELFSELNAGVAALERAQAKLKRYRASMLKAAVEGNLTEEWRRKNPPDETTEELLQRILVERRKRWEEEQLAKFKAKGQNPPKNWQQKYKKPPGPDTSDLPELPDGWYWATVDVLASPEPDAIKRGPFGSALRKSTFVAEGYKVYEQGNVIAANFACADYFISETHFASLTRFAVAPGDVLITYSGTIGRTVIVPEDAAQGVINQALLKLTLN